MPQQMMDAPMNPKVDHKGIACVLSCYVIWGLLPIFWKQLAALDALYTLAVRNVWACAFCLLLAVVTGQWKHIRAALRDKMEWRRLVLAGVALTLNWGLYIYAVNAKRLLDASLAYYLDPLLTILASRIVFGEKIRPVQWAALGIVALGLIASAVIYGAVPYLALVIALSFSVYGVIKKRCNTPAPASTLLEIGWLVPVAAAFMLLAERRGAGAGGVLTGAAMLLLPASGILTALPLFFFTIAVRRVPLNIVGILKFINPTLQMLLSVLFYGETFGARQAIPFACAWAALALYLASGSHAKHAARRAV